MTNQVFVVIIDVRLVACLVCVQSSVTKLKLSLGVVSVVPPRNMAPDQSSSLRTSYRFDSCENQPWTMIEEDEVLKDGRAELDRNRTGAPNNNNLYSVP